ncbi:hypothetical protein HZC21_05930 [Candidatus Peregrinibacteria bacterium]|nr:hypothetical protein [Candidatus Peregrinibacteria bacterium]
MNKSPETTTDALKNREQLIDRLAQQLNHTFIIKGTQDVIRKVNQFIADNIPWWEASDIFSRLTSCADLLPEVSDIVKGMPDARERAIEHSIARATKGEISIALREERQRRKDEKTAGVEPETGVLGIMTDDDGMPRENLGEGTSRTMPVIRCRD